MDRLVHIGGAFSALALMILMGCSPVVIDDSSLEDYYQCRHMQEVCRERERFEARYEGASGQQREDMEEMVSAYRMQCNEAIEQCQKAQQADTKK